MDVLAADAVAYRIDTTFPCLKSRVRLDPLGTVVLAFSHNGHV